MMRANLNCSTPLVRPRLDRIGVLREPMRRRQRATRAGFDIVVVAFVAAVVVVVIVDVVVVVVAAAAID